MRRGPWLSGRTVVLAVLVALLPTTGGCILLLVPTMFFEGVSRSHKTVDVQVLDGDTGRPVAGASVELSYHVEYRYSEPSVRAVTDAEGHARLRVVKGWRPDAKIAAAGYLSPDPYDGEPWPAEGTVRFRLWRPPAAYYTLVVPAGFRGKFDVLIWRNESPVSPEAVTPREQPVFVSTTRPVPLPPLPHTATRVFPLSRVRSARYDDGVPLPLWCPPGLPPTPDYPNYPEEPGDFTTALVPQQTPVRGNDPARRPDGIAVWYVTHNSAEAVFVVGTRAEADAVEATYRRRIRWPAGPLLPAATTRP